MEITQSNIKHSTDTTRRATLTQPTKAQTKPNNTSKPKTNNAHKEHATPNTTQHIRKKLKTSTPSTNTYDNTQKAATPTPQSDTPQTQQPAEQSCSHTPSTTQLNTQKSNKKTINTAKTHWNTQHMQSQNTNQIPTQL